VQMATYAAWAVRRWPELQHVRVSHGYLATRAGEVVADKRSALISLDTIWKKWERIESQVLAMTHVARERDVERVEANYASCTSFGGCPFSTVCPRSPERVLVDLLGSRAIMVTNNAMTNMNGPGASVAGGPVTNGLGAALTNGGPQCVTCGENLTPANAHRNNDGTVWHMTSAITPATPLPHVGVKASAPYDPFAVSAPAAPPVVPVQPPPFESYPLNGLVCYACGKPQRRTPSGESCGEHGGVQGVAPPLPPPVTPVVRSLVTWVEPVTVLRHRQSGLGAVVHVPPGARLDGAWSFQNVNGDLSLADRAGTRPDQWYADVWEDVTSKVQATSHNGRDYLVAGSSNIPNPALPPPSWVASGERRALPEPQPPVFTAPAGTPPCTDLPPPVAEVHAPTAAAGSPTYVPATLPRVSDDSSPRYFGNIEPPGWMAWDGKAWVSCPAPVTPDVVLMERIMERPGTPSVTPPDVPESRLPDAAVPVPPGTALPPALAEIAAKHAEEAAKAAGAAGSPGGLAVETVLDAVRALDSGSGAAVAELPARLNASQGAVKKAVDALVATGKLEERKKRPRMVSVRKVVEPLSEIAVDGRAAGQLDMFATPLALATVPDTTTVPTVGQAGVCADLAALSDATPGIGPLGTSNPKPFVSGTGCAVPAPGTVTAFGSLGSSAAADQYVGEVVRAATADDNALSSRNATHCRACAHQVSRGVVVEARLHVCEDFRSAGTINLGKVSTAPLTLFIDVAVDIPGVVVTDLESYAAAIHKRVADAARLYDVRLAGKDHDLGYGRWKAAIAAAARLSPPSGMCRLVVGGDEIKAEIVNGLLPLATGGVVRPVR
jgi:hypothetical protein